LPEESPDDNNDDDDDDNNNQGNNLSSNRQPPKQLPNQLPNRPLNINDGDEENNLPDEGQNNLIAQTLIALVQVIGNMQPALVNRPREQNIAQIVKFNRYRNENSAE